MAMKCHGNVRGELRVNFLAPFVMCGALKLLRIVRANVRLNFRHSKSFWSLTKCLVNPLCNALDLAFWNASPTTRR